MAGNLDCDICRAGLGLLFSGKITSEDAKRDNFPLLKFKRNALGPLPHRRLPLYCENGGMCPPMGSCRRANATSINANLNHQNGSPGTEPTASLLRSSLFTICSYLSCSLPTLTRNLKATASVCSIESGTPSYYDAVTAMNSPCFFFPYVRTCCLSALRILSRFWLSSGDHPG